jgi:hypothetical protein
MGTQIRFFKNTLTLVNQCLSVPAIHDGAGTKPVPGPPHNREPSPAPHACNQHGRSPDRTLISLKIYPVNIVGLFGKIGDVFNKIDYHTSDDPEIVGKRFEDYVESLFSKKYFKILEKTHSFKTNAERYVESSKNPDFIFEYGPTREKFAVECKFRTKLNHKGQLEWSYPAQLKRYQEFAIQHKIPVYIVIGLEEEPEDDSDEPEGFIFNIPLSEAKYPALYESVFAKFERDLEKPFFWKNGKLY